MSARTAHRNREQRVAARVAAGGAVAAQQGAGEVVVAAGDVHDQEGEVVADVGDAQVAVELDAVDRLDVGAEQDVLRAQVAVAIKSRRRSSDGGGRHNHRQSGLTAQHQAYQSARRRTEDLPVEPDATARRDHLLIEIRA